MTLISLIDRRQRDRDRFAASLHGLALPDDEGQVPQGRSSLRAFHDRVKQRLRSGGRG